MPFVYFLYGLAFFGMGLSVSLETRLAPPGTLRRYLFAHREIALRGAAPADVHAKLAEAAQAKPEHHPLVGDFAILRETMAEIGG